VGKQLKFKKSFGKYEAVYHADVKRSGNRATLIQNASTGYFTCGNHKQNIANSLCSLLQFGGLA
jgi:hypothetical protein